ncbi:MAG: hypothetical protein LBV52_03815 [Spirochaetaceae bacterium]|nr:hypothetical protein [Spirochaetaceae bacterium]
MAAINEIKSHFKAFVKRFFPQSIKRSLILSYMKKQSVERRKVKTQLGFEVSVCDHCNLDCLGCEHFSPIACEKYLDVEKYEKDCSRLASLVDGKMEWIHLMGGEPLLHPQLCEILDITRKYFKEGSIELVSNGILLQKQSEIFWKKCCENNIKIAVTQYPIKLDYAAIEKIAKKYNVEFRYYFLGHKTMHKRPLDISGKQSIKYNYEHCHMINTCVQFINGRLYTCIMIAYIEYFNKQFNKNLTVSENDSIDIYNVKTKEEIFNFLAKPVSFCKYCNIKNTVFGLEWGVSKKDISEWT